MPTKPLTANGCSGSTMSPGRSLINAPFPKKSSTRPPPNVLERSRYIGRAGRSIVWLISSDAVMLNPVTRNAIDATSPVNGPASEKSNSDFNDGGGDLSGVIAPNMPVCMDGTKVEKSTSNLGQRTFKED